MTEDQIALLYIEAIICQEYPRERGWQMHIQLFFGDGMNEDESLSAWLVVSKQIPLHPLDWCQTGVLAEPRMTHSYNKWQKSTTGHAARKESKVSVSPKTHTYTQECAYPEDRSFSNQLGGIPAKFRAEVFSSSRN